jgi:hypothetical protein
MSALISGCSFLEEESLSKYQIIKDQPWPEIETINEFRKLPKWVRDECYNDFNIDVDKENKLTLFGDSRINKARAGAGNEYIAHSVVETCLNPVNKVEYVFVLWSGITRIDVSFGDSVVDIVNFDSQHNTRINNQNWIHAGSMLGTYRNAKKDNVIHHYVKTQHLEQDMLFYTNRTLYNIITTQSFLENKGIPYDFAFMYNPHIEYNIDEDPNILVEGSFDKSSKLYSTIDWDEFIPTSPYNWCKEQELITADNFHPTIRGIREWFESLDSANLNSFIGEHTSI